MFSGLGFEVSSLRFSVMDSAGVRRAARVEPPKPQQRALGTGLLQKGDRIDDPRERQRFN